MIKWVGQCYFTQELHSVAQSKIWNYMNPPLITKYEQNLKEIMRQSLVDVWLSIARPSDWLLQYCGCWWPGDATKEVIICYCIKPFHPEHSAPNTRNIDFLRKWITKLVCLSFTRDDPLHAISMTGLSKQTKYTKRAKVSNNYCDVI